MNTPSSNATPMREMLSALLALITCEHPRTSNLGGSMFEHCLDCGAHRRYAGGEDPTVRELVKDPPWNFPEHVAALKKCRAVLRRTVHAYNFAHFAKDPISVEALRDRSPLERRRYFEPFEVGPVTLPPLCTAKRLFRGEMVRCALAGHPSSPTHHHPWCGDWRDDDLVDEAPASGPHAVETRPAPPPAPPIADAIAAADRAWSEKNLERDALGRLPVPTYDDEHRRAPDDVGTVDVVRLFGEFPADGSPPRGIAAVDVDTKNDRPFPGKKDQ